MKLDIVEKVELPSGITASYSEGSLTIKGPKGEVSRLLKTPKVSMSVQGNVIEVNSTKATKREKRIAYSFLAHIKNMILGVQEPFVYRLKICSGHFPMNVSVQGDKLLIKNFLGEKNPRTLTLKKGAKVKIDGDIITVESVDKEVAGNVSSDIELLTAVRGRDLRIFQDGIYLIEKAGQKIGEK